jgi:curved DNA-binding protein CbpA
MRDDSNASSFSCGKIAEAHETLTDESKRRAYDLLYFAKEGTTSSSGYRNTPPRASPPRSNALSDAAEIASLQRSRNDRFNRWRISRAAILSAICGYKMAIELLEHEIGILTSIEAAEAAVEARDRSWTMWLLSSWYKKLERSEDDKAHDNRARQERRMRRNLQERFLEMKKSALEQQRASFENGKKDYELADSVDDRKIDVIRDRASERRCREVQAARAKAERVERLRMEQAARQWELERRQREVIEEMESRRRQVRSSYYVQHYDDVW